MSQIEIGTRSAKKAPRLYDRAALTYADTFESPLKRGTIRTLEWLTAKPAILRMIRRFERHGEVHGQDFWRVTLDVMRIPLTTPKQQIDRIPPSGPTVLVANHPHGLVDGMVLAELIGRRRQDYRILTRSLLTGIDREAAAYMIPVPFPHEPDAQRKMLDMRRAALDHLARGGLVAVFPSGSVAASETAFGPPVEAGWNVFTAKLIRTSRAAIVPCYFPGRNSRAYQIANRVSATLRQGLLLHEIVRACGKPQSPVIGEALPFESIAAELRDPRRFMSGLRARTLALGGDQRVGTGSSPV